MPGRGVLGVDSMRSLLRSLSSAYFKSRIKRKYPFLQPLFSVPSQLTPQERYQLFELAAGRETVLEIGSYTGASACCFGSASKQSGKGRVFCIDTWNNDSMSEGCKDTYQEFLQNTSSFSDFIVPIRGLSTEVAAHFKTEVQSVDLLFIDGDHSYSGVKADWETYKDRLRQGSIVVFHDYGWADGVRRVVHEDVSPYIDVSAQLPNMWWGTVSQHI